MNTEAARHHDPLRVFVKGGQDLLSCLFASWSGRTDASSSTLSEMLRRETDEQRQIQVLYQPCGPSRHLLKELRSLEARRADGSAQADDIIVTAPPDVLILSVSSDIASDVEDFEKCLEEIVCLLRRLVVCHVLVFNASSIVPGSGVEHAFEGTALQIHRLNLAVCRLSAALGISVIDVDRIIAEMGGREHVAGALRYSPTACLAICEEVVRVLRDYAFFAPRPIIRQFDPNRRVGPDLLLQARG